MLVKHASINKEALFGALLNLAGRGLSWGAGKALTGTGKLLGFGIRNPGKALTGAGVGMGVYDSAGKAFNNFEEIAATPYRYF